MSKYNLTGLVLENKLQLTEGTRAMVAYIDGDKLTATYNHYDGYPENLGKGLEAHYNDDAKAKEVASKGYITYLDPETGDIDATHKDQKPTVSTLPSDDEDMAEEIAGQIDGMGGDYGYIWDDRANNWVTIKNTGIRSMIDQIMDKMGDYGEMNETIKEEAGFTEVSEKEIRFHLDAYKGGHIDGDDLAQAIEEIVFGETRAPGTMEESDTLNEDCCAKAKSALKGEDANQVDLYLKSLKNDIRLNGEDSYKDYSSEDFVEDFKEYIGNKSVAEHFKRFM